MPQQTHSLTHLLLFWTTILSIIQIVFIVLFFTNGHMSQNTKAVEAEHKTQIQAITPSASPEPAPLLGKMISFTVNKDAVNKLIQNITWDERNAEADLVLCDKHYLKLMKDGYYFLNLRVTLSAFRAHTVSLWWNNKVIMEGWIKTNSSSTGLLGKVEYLSAGAKLFVSINPPTQSINTTAFMTYLDIIYMKNHMKVKI